jgi:ribosomal protein L11 methyltransferase
MAFGTGTHATTRLCIAELDRLVADRSPTVLDIGCGSGVLTIAAGKLGARLLGAIDNDPDAVRIANENLGRNGVAPVAATIDVAALREPAEIVVANILPHILIDMSTELTRLTAPGGALILSGIVSEQLDNVEAHFANHGLHRVSATSEGDWQCVTLRRPR